MPASKLPAWVGVALSDGNYAIYQVVKANAPAAAQVREQRVKFSPQLGQLAGQHDAVAYLEGLKSRAKIERFESRLAEKSEPSR